jgi:hypothetical protein
LALALLALFMSGIVCPKKIHDAHKRRRREREQLRLPLARILRVVVFVFLPALFFGCARFHSVQVKTEADGSRTESRQSVTTFFDAKTEIARLRASTTDKTQGLTVGSIAEESSGSNVVSLVHEAVDAAVSASIRAAVPVPK